MAAALPSDNLLYDVGELTIPTDNVDEELRARPSQWDIRFIRRFMAFFGPISSAYDFLTFAVMLEVFGAGERLFRSGWFVESLATQTLVRKAAAPRRGWGAAGPAGGASALEPGERPVDQQVEIALAEELGQDHNSDIDHHRLRMLARSTGPAIGAGPDSGCGFPATGSARAPMRGGRLAGHDPSMSTGRAHRAEV